MAAIEIYDCLNIKIGKIHVDGADIGVKARNLKNGEFGEAVFKNTRVPWDIQESKHITIENSSITKDPKVKERRLSGSAHIGWRKRGKGPPLPSHCPDCDRIFPSANYDLHGRMFFVWNAKDVCLECGSERAYVSEGLFNLLDETAEVLRGPEITQQMVRRLRQLSKKVDSGRLNPGAAVMLAASIHPELGRVAEKYWGGTASKILILSAIASAILTFDDVGKRIGVLEDETVKKSDIEQMLKDYEKLWQRRHEQTDRRIIDESVKVDAEQRGPGAETENSPAEKGSAISAQQHEPNSSKRQKKTRRLQQIKHRNSFGRSRTR